PAVTADLLGLSDRSTRPSVPEPATELGAPPTLAAVVDNAERAHLQEALVATKWNVSRAAARLGISRNTIRYRIEKHGLRPDAPAPPRRRRQGSPPATPPPHPPAPAPAEELPSRVVGIRWERRRLAVLLARLAAVPDAGPLDTGRVIEALLEKARSFGGRVEELAASGFVVLFGLDPIEDPVRRAALAALAMRRAADRASEETGPGPRIGIDLGSLLLGRLPDASMVDAEDKRTVIGAAS